MIVNSSGDTPLRNIAALHQTLQLGLRPRQQQQSPQYVTEGAASNEGGEAAAAAYDPWTYIWYGVQRRGDNFDAVSKQ